MSPEESPGEAVYTGVDDWSTDMTFFFWVGMALGSWVRGTFRPFSRVVVSVARAVGDFDMNLPVVPCAN